MPNLITQRHQTRNSLSLVLACLRVFLTATLRRQASEPVEKCTA